MTFPYPQNEINATAGLQELFIYANTVTNSLFMRLILLGVFIIVIIGMYRQRRDLPEAFASAGFLTMVVAIFLRIVNVVNNSTLALTIVIAVMGVLYLYTARD